MSGLSLYLRLPTSRGVTAAATRTEPAKPARHKPLDADVLWIRTTTCGGSPLLPKSTRDSVAEACPPRCAEVIWDLVPPR